MFWSGASSLNFRIPDFPLGALFATIVVAVVLLFAFPTLPFRWRWVAAAAFGALAWVLGAGTLASAHPHILYWFYVLSKLLRSIDGLTYATFSLVVATACAVYVSYITDKTLKTTLKANITQNRAFIFRVGYKLNRNKSDDGKLQWHILPIIENSGNVPTMTLRVFFDSSLTGFEFNKPIICPANFKGIKSSLSSQVFNPRLLGPRQTSSDEAGDILIITPDEIKQLPNRRIFVWGLMLYSDEFGGPQHETRFCNGLILKGDPNEAEDMTYGSVPPTSGNCFDDQCDKEDAALGG
jgi:hypothetical protein